VEKFSDTEQNRAEVLGDRLPGRRRRRRMNENRLRGDAAPAGEYMKV